MVGSCSSCLKVEGIFRVNAENGQEVYVRDQLNKGVVPPGVDLHCLASLIKVFQWKLSSRLGALGENYLSLEK